MPNQTAHYKLSLPLPEEYYSIDAVNAVTQAVDDALWENAQAVETLREDVDASIEQEVSSRISALTARVTVNEGKLTVLWDAVFTDVTKNPFAIVFTSLDGITVTAGNYNGAHGRLEC